MPTPQKPQTKGCKMGEERLQKILADAGVASRRKSEKYITDGRVKVNGKVVRVLGSKADPTTDRIDVDGWGELHAQEKATILLHKPPLVISSVDDPEKRRTVLDVVDDTRAVGKRSFEGELPRLYPVGRLDFDAEGLILLSNDGDLANGLIHPRNHVPKTYLVKVKGRADPKALERMRRGLQLPDAHGRPKGKRTMPAEVRIEKQSPANTWLELTIFEGRNHQVKRMCQAVGLWVLRLIRTGFAGLELEDIPQGAWRFLTKGELAALQRWYQGKYGES